MLRLMENKTCTVEGCASPLHLREMCIKHYQRFMRHGDVNHGRPAGYGDATAHPLRKRWQKLKALDALGAEWMDFWTFVQDVGDPGEGTKLLRLDDSRPFGKDNFRWALPLTPERNAAYQKAWRDANPHAHRASHMRRNYDITLDQYDVMLKRQGGACAICKAEESRYARVKDGSTRRLCVDHDHKTGKVRGLLCGDCNVALGAMKDSRENFLAAVAYLDQHKAEGKKAA